jgi:MSHA biogenesis protein MshP
MRHNRCQAGIALASAIFLLVVLAGLGAIILTVGSLQQTSSARDVMGSKAFQAARAGIEWGAYKVLQQGLPGSCFTPPTTIAMPAGTDLTGLSATVSCAVPAGTFNEGTRSTGAPGPAPGGVPLEFYVITSTACNQPPCPNTTSPGPAYVERQLQVSIGR